MLLATAVATLVAAASPSRPSPAAVSRAFERCRDSVVRVVGGGKGDAVVIGPRGELLTALSVARSDTLTVLVAGARHSAKVVWRDADANVAVAVVDAALEFKPAAVGRAARLAAGSYLVVVGHPDENLVPVVARMSRYKREPQERAFRVDIGLRPGSAVFTAKGDLVAIQVDSSLADARTVAIDWVKERFPPTLASAP